MYRIQKKEINLRVVHMFTGAQQYLSWKKMHTMESCSNKAVFFWGNLREGMRGIVPVILGIDSWELFRLFMCFLDIHAYINLFVQSLCFQNFI